MSVPRVLHIVDTFGARSQTFIYTFVTNHRAFTPQVVCRQRDLAAEFPFDSVTTVPEEWSRAHPARWWSTAVEGVTGRTPWQRRIERTVRDVRPDVVHAHFGQVGVRVLPAMQRVNVPLVTSFYGYDATGFADSEVGRRLIPRLTSFGTLFLAEGPVMSRRVISLGAPAERVRIVPIAIDLSKYPAWAPSTGVPVVLFVARFVEKKGLPDAIAAFSRARAVLPELRMRIIGDGPEEKRALEAAATLGVADAIEWLGPRPHVEVIDHLRQSTVLLQPSLTARDGDTEGGAPTTLIEAQAIGIPIVATRHADIPHVAPAGRGVHLADERDVPGLAGGLVDAVRNLQPSDAAGVRTRHDVRQVMPLLERCYRDAMHMPARSAA
jgi:glycosyltransferase involved in cell wall biosynthesis